MRSDYLTDALVFLLKNYFKYKHIDIGSSTESTVIRGLAQTIASVVGYDWELVFDSSKPDGTPRKLMDSSRLHELGWNNVRPLEEGIASTYGHWLASQT